MLPTSVCHLRIGYVLSCVSHGTAAFQPQRRCTPVKTLTINPFYCPVCTVTAAGKPQTHSYASAYPS